MSDNNPDNNHYLDFGVGILLGIVAGAAMDANKNKK